MQKDTIKKHNHHILNICKFSFTIIGTLIGAGFASGKEITTFFGCYGNLSYIIMFAFCVVFAIGVFYFSSINPDNIPPILSKLINIAIFISEIISITAMMAGLNSVMSMLFINDIPYFLALILIFLIIICGIKGLTTTNLVLIPFLFIFILTFGISGLSEISSFEVAVINTSKIFKFLSLPLYIGLNLFSIFPIALEFGKSQTKKVNFISAIISATILLILMLCFTVTIMNIDSTSASAELPIVIYVLTHKPNLVIVSVVTLSIAIITTIISDGFVVRGMLTKKSEAFANMVFALIFMGAYYFSNFGFAEIVENFYPINGLLGLMLILIIVYNNRRTKLANTISYKISNHKKQNLT